MNELALFAGAGGGILGGHLLGWRTVCAVEWEPYPASVLCARQNDGLLPSFPIWDDVQTFDGRPWRGIVDVVSGGFPCQDISSAGRGDGLDGERSGMWKHMARVVGEVRPRYVFVENSPMLTHRGGVRVIGDLAALGYDSRWIVMGAADVGAPHQRNRFWLVAHTKSNGCWEGRTTRDILKENGGQDRSLRSESCSSSKQPKNMANANGMRKLQPQGREQDERRRIGDGCGQANVAHAQCGKRKVGRDDAGMGSFKELGTPRDAGTSPWSVEPDVGRVAHGVAARVDRLKAIGNGQVPLCAATAWRILTS